MRLSDKEFKFMQGTYWKFRQRHLSFRTLGKFGLQQEKEKDILEIGCGSGFGAELLSQLNPKSYEGIDIMEEQIAIAEQKGLPNCKFQVVDATDLSQFPDASKDLVVMFTILHHIPQWRDVLAECWRVLRDGGRIYVEEPNRTFIRVWDFFFRWGHAPEALFSYDELEEAMQETGFDVVNRKRSADFGFWSAQKRSNGHAQRD